MTQEERDAIRARCEAATPGHYKQMEIQKMFVNYHRDIPALLDALDAETNRADEAVKNQNIYLGFTAKEWHQQGVVIKEELEKVLAECIIDRDHWKARVKELELEIACLNAKEKAHYEKRCDRYMWKARAEALEQAIKRSSACGTCSKLGVGKQYENEPCTSCEGHSNWQFDEVRFAVKSCKTDGSVESEE